MYCTGHIDLRLGPKNGAEFWKRCCTGQDFREREMVPEDDVDPVFQRFELTLHLLGPEFRGARHLEDISAGVLTVESYLVLGLAGTCIAVTAGVYLSVGLAAPARAGLSVVKAAKRTEHIGLPLLRLLKLEKREKLVEFVSDVGRVQQRTSMRGALDTLKVAERPADMARLASLAAVKGTKTRAIVKLLGRGAIFVATSTFTLASWMFWALINLFGFCAACKRTAERMTLRHCERRRMRRLRAENQRLAAALQPA